MTDTSTQRRNSSFVPIILLTIIAIAAGAGATWFVTAYRPQKEAEEQSASQLMLMTGLDHPVKNHLGANFVDEDNDMVADVPKDASKLIDPPKLVFSFIAADEPEVYEKQWQAFCEHLSKVTGKPVEYLKLQTSEDQLKALRDGQLHVTGFNSGSVPMAVNVCGYVPVARIPTTDAAGTRVAIIVPSDSPIHNLVDFHTKKYTLALTEPNSNSGYKAPMVLLYSDYGLAPERDYFFRTTNDHRLSIEGVAKHQYDAAAVSADLLAREESQGRIRKTEYRKIYDSESFPSAALGYCYNLKPELAAKVREAIMTFDMAGTPLEQEFSPMSQTKLIAVNYKNDWALIRRIDDASGRTHVLK